MKKIALMALLSLAACVAPEASAPPGQPYKLTQTVVNTVRSDVRASMKDPGSARFGQIAAAQAADGIITVCGWVNGKNSYGGYTGELPFMGIYSQSTGRFMVADIASAAHAQSTVQVCRNRGVAI